MSASITIHPSAIEAMAEADINNIAWIGGNEVFLERFPSGRVFLTARPKETARTNFNIGRMPRYRNHFRAVRLDDEPPGVA